MQAKRRITRAFLIRPGAFLTTSPLLLCVLPLFLFELSIAAGAGAQVVPAPDSVTATETAPGEITVTWTEVPGAKDYLLFKETWPNGARSVGVITGTRYVDRVVKAGGRYSYIVGGRGAIGNAGRRKKSNDIIAGSGSALANPPAVPDSTPKTITNPQITTPVTATSNTTPLVVGPPPAGAEGLASPRTDTTSCQAAQGDTSAAALEQARLDAQAARIGARAATDPTQTPTTELETSTGAVAGSATYREGKCRNGIATGYPDLWDPVASASGLSTADQISSWKEIGVVALAYKHLLGRQPTTAEIRRDVAALRAGTTWKQLWRQLAQSPERDSRFGFWAPAPIPTPGEARQAFGLSFTPVSQQCFGAIGPKCAGGIPDVMNDKVQPAWFGTFRMPDNTSMGYVQIGTVVGSILHDNACLRDMGGLNCNGLGAGDFIKTGLWPASLEWNKAAWNVIDHRSWRETFGPYPTDASARDADWYDDIRLVTNRNAMMAPVISIIAFPGLTVQYHGGETRRTKALQAPSGTSLDDTDVGFCKSGAFSSQGVFPLKASWGICR
jgi:hypothetical protein